MRLAIVGSTQLAGRKVACNIICRTIEEIRPILVVSGGAIGVDQMGVLIAEHVYNIPTMVYFPITKDWAGYKARNILVASNCDYLLRIVWANSNTYGSGWTMERAKKNGARVKEYVCL